MPGINRYFPMIYAQRCRRFVSTTLSNPRQRRRRRWTRCHSRPFCCEGGATRRCSIASGPARQTRLTVPTRKPAATTIDDEGVSGVAPLPPLLRSALPSVRLARVISAKDSASRLAHVPREHRRLDLAQVHHDEPIERVGARGWRRSRSSRFRSGSDR
jgi:hypothetical protein